MTAHRCEEGAPGQDAPRTSNDLSDIQSGPSNGVGQAIQTERITQIIPAPGWWKVHDVQHGGDDFHSYREPVTAFAIVEDAKGNQRTVALGGDDFLDAADLNRGDALWLHGESWCTCGYTPSQDEPDSWWCQACGALHPGAPS